jgi:hypothetical protein
VVAATERLIEQHNPAWGMGGGDGRYPAWRGDVVAAGFTNVETFEFDHSVDYSPMSWRGRIRASAGVGGSLDPQQALKFDADLAALLAAEFPQDPLAVPHRVFAVVARTG